MGKALKKLIKKGLLDRQPKSLDKFLEFDRKNPDEVVEFQKYKLLYQLNKFMLQHNISKASLAKRLGISRQAVTNKFLGETLTIDWLIRAFAALGVGVNTDVAISGSLP